MIIPPWAKLVAVGAVLAVAFGVGWRVNGWRLESNHAEEARVQADAAKKVLDKRTAERDMLSAALAVSNDANAAKLEAEKNATNSVRDDVSVGARVLRVRAACPAPAGLPASAAASSVDPGAGAELDPAARRAYFALRDGINVAEGRLGACQDELRKRTAAP